MLKRIIVNENKTQHFYIKNKLPKLVAVKELNVMLVALLVLWDLDLEIFQLFFYRIYS